MYKAISALLLLLSGMSFVSAQNTAPENGIWGAAWSPDGKLLAVANPGGLIHIYNEKNELIHTLSGHQPRALAVTWSPDGQTLATSGWDTFIRFWDVRSGELLHEINAWSSVVLLDWQPNGDYLATASSDTVQVWNTTTYEPVTIGAGATLLDLEWSPDGSSFAYGAIHTVGVAKINGDQFDVAQFTIDGQSMRATSIAWSGDGTQVVSTGSGVRIWDAETGEQISLLFENDETFRDAIFIGEENDRVLAITEEGGIYTFDVATEAVIESVKEDAFLWSLAWNPQFDLLAIAGTAGQSVNSSSDSTNDVASTGFLELVPITFDPDTED